MKPIMIGDKSYYTIQQMSLLIKKTDQTVYSLIKRGNAIRKMKNLKLMNRILIPCSELIQFPFTYPGTNAKNNIYHYNAQGKIVESSS